MPKICWMTKSQHRRAEMVRNLALRETEGLTFDELARRTGIPVGTLSTWSRRLRLEDERRDNLSFVEIVELAQSEEPIPQHEDEEACVNMRHPSGAVIEFHGAAAIAATSKILEDLTSWS